jgi:hypothetical protein
MTLESTTPVSPVQREVAVRDSAARYVHWTPIILGALAATALSSILITFGAAVGLGVTSTAPTWRDASAALWILSGIYLIILAILSFGVGGYIAGRVRAPVAGYTIEETEHADGVHGLGAWSLAVVMGTILAGFVANASLPRPTVTTSASRASSAEPLLSYEIDKLFRAGRKTPTVDLGSERAEAGRILLTASGHQGMSADDRTYLVQQVAGITGLSPPDAERRVDNVIADSRTAVARSRRSTIILAFSVATALLLGAVAAWAAACAGGRHRDGEPLPEWMTHSHGFERRRTMLP